MRPRYLETVAGVIVFALCLAAYGLTLAPTITWAHDGVDSGDLVTAAYTRGVAHPPGYPLFLFLARVFILLPLGEIAHRVNLLSALCAAATAALVYCTILLLIPHLRDTPSRVSVAGGSALLFAFSQTFWSQAVIAEVYTLNALLVAASVLLATLHRRTGDRRFLWALGLTLGLGLTNHLSTFIFLPTTLYLALGRRPTARSSYLALAGFLVLGLSLYLYLPLCSAGHPPIDWGGSRSLSGFWWTVSARIYSDYLFGVPVAFLPARMISWLRMLAQQFTWAGFALGLVGLWDLFHSDRRFLVFSLASFGAVAAYSVTYNTSDSYVYLMPSFLVFALWIARGASYVSVVAARLGPTAKRDGLFSPSRVQRVVSLLMVVVLPVVVLLLNAPRVSLRHDRSAYEYAARVLATTPSDALIIADTDAHVFALWYVRYVQTPEPAPTIVAKGLLHYPWYRDTLRWNEPHVAMTLIQGDPSAQLIAFIDANLPERPVFLTDYDERILAHYSYSRQGSLYKLGTKG